MTNSTSKIDLLKSINNKIDEKVHKIQENEELMCIYSDHNCETSYEIHVLNKGKEIRNLQCDEYKRILCTKGEVKVEMKGLDGDIEESVINSLNTCLITPKIKHNFIAIEDSEIIIVYKPKIHNERIIVVDKNKKTQIKRYE
jgi:dTDP-4-dehydrorhamnose 3,5-epimerase-like enzyme